MLLIHHYIIILKSFSNLKISCCPPIHHHELLTATHPFCLGSLTFSRMSYGWDHTTGSHFRLASYSQQYAFKLPPCLLTAWELISFLLLNNIQLYGCTRVSIHLWKNVLVTSSFGKLIKKIL